ncbi:MAG TPA: hypothetical protein VEZ11_04650 [Thermoanaerobaculia bacterium]|nr:hypothetical protein [Thermoanaerobaculia bacterium]
MRDTPARSNRSIHPSLLNHTLFLVFAVSLTAAGCATSAPMATTRRAVNAVRSGNLDRFRSQLAPEARTELGTNERLGVIQRRLADYKNVSIAPAIFISSTDSDQQRTYKATVKGSWRKGAPPEPIYTFLLDCSVSYYEVGRGPGFTACADTGGDQSFIQCDAPFAGSFATGERESCSIAGIERPQEDKAD